MGAIAMTGFFMLSGYSLYVTYRKKDLYKLNEIRIFYIKRFIGVFPIYYVTALAYVILLGKETLIENILLAPISFLGLQSIYTGTFSISHVGGTWFISCITLCYLVYPYLQILVNQMENKGKITLIVICVFILFWSPFLRHIFSLSTYYDNPLIRLMEFMVGILIANLNLADNVKWVKLFQTKMSLCAGCVILFSGVSLLRYFTRNGDYMLYDWIALPSFIMIIMSSGKLQFVKLSNNKVISYLSALSYDFFLAQFFVWPICRKIFILTGFTDNIFKIVISLIICFIISILMHELIEKPVKRYLNSQMLKPKLVTI